VVEKLSLKLPYYSWSEEVVTEIREHGFDLILRTFRLFRREGKFTVEKGELRKIPKVPLYTQGSLIQEMKRRGLGRPSTYAQIVQTLLDRGYVRESGGRLVPTRMGIRIYSYLREHYPDYVSEELTRELETAMDRIERGEMDYLEPLHRIHRIKELLREGTGDSHHG